MHTATSTNDTLAIIIITMASLPYTWLENNGNYNWDTLCHSVLNVFVHPMLVLPDHWPIAIPEICHRLEFHVAFATKFLNEEENRIIFKIPPFLVNPLSFTGFRHNAQVMEPQSGHIRRFCFGRAKNPEEH